VLHNRETNISLVMRLGWRLEAGIEHEP